MDFVISSEAIIHIQCGLACGQVESIGCMYIQEDQLLSGGAENGLDKIP